MENEQVFSDQDIIINEYGVFMNDDALERFKNSQEYQNVRRKVIDFLIEQKRYFGADIDSFRSMSSTSLDVDMEDRHKPLLKDLASPYLTGNNRLWLQSQLTELEKQLRETYKEIIVSNDIKQEDIVAELKKREGTERAEPFNIFYEIKIIDNTFRVLSDDRIRTSTGYKAIRADIEQEIKSKKISKKSLPEKIEEYKKLISQKLDGTNTNLKEAAYLAGLDYIRCLAYEDVNKGIELKRGRPLARFTRQAAEAIVEAFDKVKGKGKEILESYYAENNRSERKKYRAEEQQRQEQAKQKARQRKEEQKQKEQQRKAEEKQAEQRRKAEAKQAEQKRKEEQKQEEQKRKKRNKSLAELEKQERQLEKQQDKVKKDREKITEQITTISKDIEDYFIKSKIADLEDSIKEESKNPRQVYVSDGIKEKIAKELGDETTTKLETLLRERRRLKEKIDNLDTQLEGIRDQKYKMRNLIDGGLSY